MSLDAASHWLALGDSYTIGEGVGEYERWPSCLQQALQASATPLAAPEIIARTGWTCAELEAGMDAATLTPPYAMVSLCIGVNDQYDGLDAARYRPQFKHLLQRAIDLADARPARVLVVSIPDWSRTRFAAVHGRDQAAEAAAIDAYNLCAQQETDAAGGVWVDVTALSRAYPNELAADGLHPSAAQYLRWLEPIAAAARMALARGTPRGRSTKGTARRAPTERDGST